MTDFRIFKNKIIELTITHRVSPYSHFSLTQKGLTKLS